jgi:hypothetical protein
MTRRLLDYDPVLGTAEYIHYDEQTGATWIETVEDETALVEANKAEFNTYTSGKHWGNGEELDPKNRVLRLSATMTAELHRRGVLQDPVRLMAWADTDEAIPYRTRPGALKGTGRHV